MPNPKTPALLSHLLNTYPGIHSTNICQGMNELSIEFRCSSIASLGKVVYSATYSNVVIQVGSLLDYEDFRAVNEAELRFILAPKHEYNESTPTNAEVFGVHVVRDLYVEGLIDKAEMIQIHKEWNAAPI